MRKLLPLLILFVLPAALSARGRVFGWCEQGGSTVPVSVQQGAFTGDTLIPVQTSFPNCTVTVKITGTSTSATIYSDNIGTAKANPFTADASGYWFFYTNDGQYDVTFSNGGIVAPFTEGAQTAFDPKSIFELGATCNGSTDDSASLAAAFSAAANSSIFFPSTAHCVNNSNLTIPANVVIRADAGSYIQTNSTFTLTVAGDLTSIGRFQFFKGQGATVMGVGRTHTVYPEWWGAIGDGTTDNSAALISAESSIQASGGTMDITCGRYVMASGFTVPTINVNVKGAGSACTVFLYTGTGAFLEARMNPFSTTPAGKFEGFTVDGSGAGASTQGILTGDMVGGIFSDIVINNFSTGTGFAVINGAMSNGGENGGVGWFERNLLDVEVKGDGTGILFQVNGGTDSFGYNTWTRMRLNTATGQIGVHSLAGTDNVFLYHNSIRTIYNGAGGTMWQEDGNSNFDQNSISITGECSASPATTGFLINSGSSFKGYGYADMTLCTNVDNNSAQANNHASFRIQATNPTVTLDGGTFSNWFGVSGSTATLYPLWMQDGANGSTIGVAEGNNIGSVYVSMLLANTNGVGVFGVGNCFCIFADAPGATPNQKNLLSYIDEGGRFFIDDSINITNPAVGLGIPGSYIPQNKITGIITVASGQVTGSTNFQNAGGNTNYQTSENCTATPLQDVGTTNSTIAVSGGGGGTVTVPLPIRWWISVGPTHSPTPNRFSINIQTSVAVPANTVFSYTCIGDPN